MASTISPSPPPSSPSIHGTLQSYLTLSSSAQSPLLNLPAELRLMIYSYVFTTHQTIVPKPDRAYRPLEVLYSGVRLDGILVACRQLYAETYHFFYDKTCFIFESRYITIPRAMDSFTRKIGEANTKLINRILILRDEEPLRWNGVTDPNINFRLGKPMKWTRKFKGLKVLRLVFTKTTTLYGFACLRTWPRWGFRTPNEEQQPTLKDFLESVDMRVEVKIRDPEAPPETELHAGSWLSGKLAQGKDELPFFSLQARGDESETMEPWEVVAARR
ncbi:MAG: hypothetical protein Q9182_007087 [Xanthomendoza sp. 2 TL-2023]